MGLFLSYADDHLDAVYDISIAYPYNCPQTEPELIMGNVPREVHFNIVRYSADLLPSTEAELEEWCKERWQEKEQCLKNFKQNSSFHPESSDSGASGDHLNMVAQSNSNETKTQQMLKFALVYWTLFVLGITALLVYSSLARWLALFQVGFYLYMGHVRGGFELFQADYFNWFFDTKKRK